MDTVYPWLHWIVAVSRDQVGGSIRFNLTQIFSSYIVLNSKGPSNALIFRVALLISFNFSLQCTILDMYQSQT